VLAAQLNGVAMQSFAQDLGAIAGLGQAASPGASAPRLCRIVGGMRPLFDRDVAIAGAEGPTLDRPLER
jgi:hypothetical protein